MLFLTYSTSVLTWSSKSGYVESALIAMASSRWTIMSENLHHKQKMFHFTLMISSTVNRKS